MPEKITQFTEQDNESPVSYIETIEVAEGVSCDTYSFEADETRDLAVVEVKAGCKTPLQRILQGELTVEGYMSGEGTLTIDLGGSGTQVEYNFPGDINSVVVEIDDIMQWTAKTDLVFYEACTPPYQDGRFENIPS